LSDGQGDVKQTSRSVPLYLDWEGWKISACLTYQDWPKWTGGRCIVDRAGGDI